MGCYYLYGYTTNMEKCTKKLSKFVVSDHGILQMLICTDHFHEIKRFNLFVLILATVIRLQNQKSWAIFSSVTFNHPGRQKLKGVKSHQPVLIFSLFCCFCLVSGCYSPTWYEVKKKFLFQQALQKPDAENENIWHAIVSVSKRR